MKTHVLSALLTVGAICCSPHVKSQSHETASPVALQSSAEKVRAEALRDAAAAISNGKPYLCDTGTIAIYSPGVPKDKLELVRGLPHRMLPGGCTNPEAFRSIAYAEVFNRAIVKYLSEGKR